MLVDGGVDIPAPPDADPAALPALGALAQRIVPVAIAIAEGVPLDVLPLDAGQGVLAVRIFG